MTVRISREVLNNIVRVRDKLNEKQGGRSFPVLLNKKTGDIQFTRRMESIGTHLPKQKKTVAEDWQEVHPLWW